MDKCLRIDESLIVSSSQNEIKIKVSEQMIRRIMVRTSGHAFGRYTATLIERALIIGDPYNDYVSIGDYRFKKYRRIAVLKGGIYDVYRLDGISIENGYFVLKIGQ